MGFPLSASTIVNSQHPHWVECGQPTRVTHGAHISCRYGSPQWAARNELILWALSGHTVGTLCIVWADCRHTVDTLGIVWVYCGHTVGIYNCYIVNTMGIMWIYCGHIVSTLSMLWSFIRLTHCGHIVCMLLSTQWGQHEFTANENNL